MPDYVDLLPSAHRYVMASPEIQALITNGTIGRDGFGETFANGWVFTGTNDSRPLREVENKGTCAVVLTSYNQWSVQTNWHTSKFPRLNVFIYADVTRDVNGSPLARDAEKKAKKVWLAIDALFHNPQNTIHWFDDLFVLSTLEGDPLSILDVPDGDGAVRATVSYNITLL